MFGDKYNWLEGTAENCPLYFTGEDASTKEEEDAYHNMRMAQYFYVAAFVLNCIKTLELCTASKNLGPKVW